MSTSPAALYTPALHDALPISTFRWRGSGLICALCAWPTAPTKCTGAPSRATRSRSTADGQGPPASKKHHTREDVQRSEEHTSELQSRGHLVCRLMLEKTKSDG